MKTLIAILTLVPSVSLASLCKDIHPLQKNFEEQSNWQRVVLPEFKALQEIQGYVDKDGGLHLADLSGTHKIKGNFEAPPGEEGDNFKKACKRPIRGAKYLRTLRQLKRGNTFKVSGRFFPQIDGIANKPYQSLEAGSLEVSVEYDSSSMVNKDDNPIVLKREINSILQNQLLSESFQNSYRFELTNLDDFACDLVTGKAKINVYHRLSSDNPIIEKSIEVERPDVYKLYGEWANSTQKTKNREEAFFQVGRSFERLSQDNSIAKIQGASALSLAKKVIPENSPTVKFFNAQELSCLADSMVKYSQNRIQHRVYTQVHLDESEILNGSEE